MTPDTTIITSRSTQRLPAFCQISFNSWSYFNAYFLKICNQVGTVIIALEIIGIILIDRLLVIIWEWCICFYFFTTTGHSQCMTLFRSKCIHSQLLPVHVRVMMRIRTVRKKFHFFRIKTFFHTVICQPLVQIISGIIRIQFIRHNCRLTQIVVETIIDTHFTSFTLLSYHHDNAICSTCTIYGSRSRIFQHRHLFHIFRI